MNPALEEGIARRKALEVGHYDEKARAWRAEASEGRWETDVHGLRHDKFSSYAYFESLIAPRCAGKKVLDYGCGTGIHSVFPALHGASVVGVDLSGESLSIARERVARMGLEASVSFAVMDCERLDLPGGSVDLVIDGGTFSSLDLRRALPEIARVLKDDGCVIGIETLGHNPVTNWKRRLNVTRGVRTEWASRHILRTPDLAIARLHFRRVEARFYHLSCIPFLPFARVPGLRWVARAFDRLDSLLLKVPLLQPLAFKVVFVFEHPIRPDSHDQAIS